MTYKVIITRPFERRFKKLKKKHQSISSDLRKVVDILTTNPDLGIAMGSNCYKIRMSITSKNKGKSGGARVITYCKLEDGEVFLLDIYDKSEQVSISDTELKFLLKFLSR